ncbi:uncharacterized protein PV06_08330 [Exophiala oligosperma]|uniref:Coenzyme Q-binding protein COQ10 START domain-containing protein n=1 Tax=Exophiala oligosperma TaxID=215243 RepID=A0A0D2DW40_9EURO|nr:uncharacterized protein PV06_08330 [Exophiala oligosperma]KIW39744.1 hypothetical protein PV06_08330 [Exophiala oligosperma]
MSATLFTEPTATPSQPAGTVLFTSGGTVTINAPASVVFDTITGFSRYDRWNDWTPSLKFEAADEEVKTGLTGLLKTHMGAQARDYDVPVEIIELSRSPAKFRLCWRSKLLPSWALTAERVQEVTPVDGAGQTCQVRNWESMGGPAAYAFKYLMGIPAQLNELNVMYLDRLKEYIEKEQMKS